MENLKWKHGKTAAGVIGMLLAPFLSYIMFEYVTENLTYIPTKMALLNICLIYFVYLAVFAVSGSSRITVPVSSGIFFVISVAEAFVLSFRGRPILVSELMALETAISVAGSYSYQPTSHMVIAALVLIGANVLLWQVPVRLKGWKTRAVNGICCALAVYAGAMGFFNVLIPKMGLAVNLWSITESYEENGFLLSSVVSLQYMTKKEPDGYSTNKLTEIYGKSLELLKEQVGDSEEEIQPVNIICIMNESLADLEAAGEFEANIPYFSYMNSLTENTVRGSLCVPVFGSLTSNTEYEFLTGDAMALLPVSSIAYQFFVEPNTLSMVSTVKNQGYRTVAMHPYPGDNWNRTTCYRNMGFDEFWDEAQYQDSELLRLYVSDKADYDKIIDLVESKENPDDKLFVFNVTMQNHGGYDTQFDNFNQEVWLTGEFEGQYPKADQFLSLMKVSDDAFQYLIEYFEAKEEPTMIVMFGDHQPGVEEEFYDAISGMASDEVEWQDRLMWYETPFIIWTNYDQPSEDMGRLSSIYLGAKVLELANLEMSPYDAFRLKLAEELPVVHFYGCYEPDGSYYPWGDAQDGGHSFSSDLTEYEMLVYNHSIAAKEMGQMYSLYFDGISDTYCQ